MPIVSVKCIRIVTGTFGFSEDITITSYASIRSRVNFIPEYHENNEHENCTRGRMEVKLVSVMC